MILGIAGAAGAGKDTIADILVRDHRFTKVALADHLKRIAMDVFDFSTEQLWGPSYMRNAPDLRYVRVPSHESPIFVSNPDGTVETGVGFVPNEYLTPRFALQKLGTEWGRACYENVWIDLAICAAETLQVNSLARYDRAKGLTFGFNPTSIPQHVVIPDVRFQNEIDAIKKAGGYVVRVTRSGAGLSGSAAAHVSETEGAAIPDTVFSVVIRNEGTIDELVTMVDLAFGDWLSKDEVQRTVKKTGTET